MATTEAVMNEAPYREPVHGPENLFRLIGLLWRNVLWIVTVAIVLALLAFGASMLIPNYYTSTAQILLDPEGSRVLESDLPGQPRQVDAHVLNQQYILTSNEVLTRVVESEKLFDDPDFGAAEPGYPDRSSRVQLAVDTLRKVISVAVVGKSFVLNVTARSEDPQKAAQLANVLSNTYIQVRTEMNTDVLRRTSGGLAAQLDQLRKAVEDGDRAVQAYRAQHNLADIAGRPDSEQQIADSNAEITRLSGTIAENEALVAELNRARTDRQYLRSIPDTSLTPAIISLRARYQQSQEEEAVLARSLGTQHPSLQAARARTQSLANILDEQLRNFSTATARNLERLKNQLSLLGTNANRLKSDLNSEEQTMVQLRELQRKLDSDRAVYESFLLRTRQLSEQQGASSENPTIISAAEPPLRKAGPPRALILIGAGIFGAILAAGVILLRDQFGNRTPKTASEVPVSPIPAPSSAIVSNVPASKPVGKPAIVDERPGLIRKGDSDALIAPANEDYAGLARALTAALPPGADHRVMIVSAGPKNRAPHVSFNLAAAAARLGRRVLLVDGAPGEAALTTMLLPQTGEQEVASPETFGFEAMSLLRFAPVNGSSAAALSAGETVEQDGQPFDLVVVDGGLVTRLSSASGFGKSADETVLVQHEEDAASVVLALIALEEHGLDQTRVVRMSHAGLQY